MVSISKEKAIISIKKVFMVTMLFAIPATIFIFFNADAIVKLIFGNKFFASIVPMQILSFLFIIIGLSNVFGMEILLPFNKKKEFMKPILTAGIVSLVLNFLLVPFIKQNGAALAFLGSEIWVTFWMYLEIKKINISLLKQNTWLKLICIACCLSIFVFTTRYIGINIILNGIMYVFIYGFLLVGLKLIDIKTKTVVI
jgi:O-antigen/teichoic acid export membrane protein